MTHAEPATRNSQLDSRDWRFLFLCLLLAAVAITITARYFHAAFPEISIDFRFDRNTSRGVAETLLRSQRVDVRAMKHAVRFDTDDQARIFLERELGLDRAKRVLRDDVRVWAWHHRWYRPLVEEEISVDVAPTGEIIGYTHKLPEDRAVAGIAAPIPFLRSIGMRIDDLALVSTSERHLPKRVQRIYTFESKRVRPAGAPYRHVVTIDGNLVTSYTQSIKVPDAWLRSYHEMRSKNSAAGAVDVIFLAATMIGAVVVFIARLRRGDLSVRFLLAIAATTVVLVGIRALNEMPSQFAWYDTTTSYAAFIGQLIFFAAIESLGTAMLLIVMCGAGEVLYRERLPQHLAIPRLWTRKAVASKRVFLSLILGYALVPLFIAYQVVFYLVAQRFGAWAPAEVKYDEILNTAIPWATVLFAGFFPALSEEFLSRAFSIPWLQKIVRSRIFAIVLAAFIWGFGHAGYPNQPFWIRGVEVGVAGIVAGLLMDRFGLLPLLIWHYTIDAVYTALLLFTSGNTYYIASAGAASLIFVLPLVASIVVYLRNRGFAPDDELSNATLPLHPPPTDEEIAHAAPELPDPIPVTRNRVLICAVLVVIAAMAIAMRPESPQDVIDYRITKEQAKTIARRVIPSAARNPPNQGLPRSPRDDTFEYVIALPVEGFRSWDRESPREDGGTPGDFDEIAATWLVQHGMSVRTLNAIFRDRIEAGTWMVRFFTPMKKEEIFVEVDPRRARVIGYHQYQDEANPGPTLSQAQALAIARTAFRTYGLQESAFDLQEALTFAQPKRRDWLFHFDERTPLAPRAYRRVTVRVAGAEVTQFNKTIRIPESVYREASTQTLLNLILLVLKSLGTIALIALVIAGIVIASRRRGLPWRPALRWTLILAIIPILAAAARYESTLFGYSTSIAWRTFRIGQVVDFIREAGLVIGGLFLALAGLFAAVPYARGVLTREGRARFGASAVMAALTAIAAIVIASVAGAFVTHWMPSQATVSISAPEDAAIPFPALVETGSALTGAILLSGMVALYAVALRRYTMAITIAAIFCSMLDPLATTSQTPVMLVRALAGAVLIWVLARYVLNGNPLAWPLFAFLLLTLHTASVLLSNTRVDLIANGIAAIVFAAMAIVWAWRRNARVA